MYPNKESTTTWASLVGDNYGVGGWAFLCVFSKKTPKTFFGGPLPKKNVTKLLTIAVTVSVQFDDIYRNLWTPWFLTMLQVSSYKLIAPSFWTIQTELNKENHSYPSSNFFYTWSQYCQVMFNYHITSNIIPTTLLLCG